MLALLSPAKRLDFDSPVALSSYSLPQLLDDTGKLIKTTRNLSQKRLRELMDISADLARLNARRYQQLTTELDPSNARPAILAFKGDVYTGLDAGSLSEEDLAFAQDHIGILSGLYGYLRPLDLIQPYRLEMGTRLPTRRGRNLYEFWGDRITERIRAQLDALDTPVLVNLASAEYFKAVRARKLGCRIITPVFQDVRDGEARVLFLFAKRARGMMARYIVQQRITDPDALQGFDGGGYRFRPDLSDTDRWVFQRPQPPPARR